MGNPSTTRRSSNSQDAAHSRAEVGVQTAPRRSIVKGLEVKPVMPKIVQAIMEEKHYLHSMPAASRMCFGVYLDDELNGAVVFTAGPRHGHRLLDAAKPQEIAVLARLWLSDDLPANSESRVIGIVLRYLRRHTKWKLILSYADPTAGHIGTIYQATGWQYLGMTEANSYVGLADGKAHHPRSVYEAFGSNNIRHLRATGIAATRIPAIGKHRYVCVLDPRWRWRLRPKIQAYPRKEGDHGS